MSKRARRPAHRANNENDGNRYTETQNGNILRVEQFHRSPRQRIKLLPRNLAQESYIEALEDPNINIVFAIGYAGSGKTYLSTLYAIRQYLAGEISKIVITRPNIAVDDKDIGFLPGDILRKMAPWTKPVLDVFEEHFDAKEMTRMIEENIIELVPLAYMRGRTFKNSVVILDEAQNTTVRSMLSTLTRIGEGSKMLITGDVRQSDRGIQNGLSDFVTRYDGTPSIRICHFDKNSVERHPIITDLLRMYGEE